MLSRSSDATSAPFENIVLDGVGLPFDEGLAVVAASGALIVLDAQGRALWEALRAGCSLDELAAVCTEADSMGAHAAYVLLERIFACWQRAGIFDRNRQGTPGRVLGPRGTLPTHALAGTYRIGERPVTLRCSDRGLGALIDAALHPFRIERTTEPPALIEVTDDGGRFIVHSETTILARVGTPAYNRASARHRCLTALIEVANPSRQLLAIVHASAVARDGRCVLLAGPSGSGKSTLAAFLVARGYQFVTDDYAPIELGSWLVWPVPFAASIKSGSWKPLLAAFPELDRQPTFHHRGLKLRYLHHGEGARASPYAGLPIAAIVLPRYLAGQRIEVQRISATELLTAICAARSLLDLRPELLRETLALLELVPAYRLRYGCLNDAAAWLERMRTGP